MVDDEFGPEGNDRQAPFRRSVGAAIVTVVVLVEIALAGAYLQLNRSSANLRAADSLSIAFTDVQRQFQELEFLAATEPRFDTPQVQTELALLERQLSIGARRLEEPTTSSQLAGDVRAQLQAFDDLRAVSTDDPTNMSLALALAARGQENAQAAVDRTARQTRDLFLEEAAVAEGTAMMIAMTASLLLAAGAFAVWGVLRRYQRSFDEAWRIAAARREALQATNEQLAALAQTRERFVSVLSHELRSPLAVIGAAGETLHQRGHELDEATRAGILQSLRRQVTRQQRMINDLLMVAQHANSEPDPEPADIDLSELLGMIQRDDELTDIHTTVVVADDVVVHADPHHVEQVIDNLVRNAEKYGGEHVVVTARPDLGEVLITVADDGPGVPEELRATLFEPFTQGEDLQRGGVGLGLSITRQLVEANGGSISYRDGVDGGAVFEVRLPTPAHVLPGGATR